MSQVLLEQPESIARVIKLHCMNSEAITQPMWTYSVPLACLGVNQIWQPGSLSTPPYHLPGSVSIDAEDEPLTFLVNWTTSVDIFFQHLKSILIDR